MMTFSRATSALGSLALFLLAPLSWALRVLGRVTGIIAAWFRPTRAPAV